MKQNQNLIRNKYTICYLIAVPAGVLAATLFAMSLQPVIDAGVAGRTDAFLLYSGMAVVCCLADICLSYAENFLRDKMRTFCAGELRSRYFGCLFQKKSSCFFEKNDSYYLSKLTADPEVIAEKYFESICQIYRSVWSLAISLIAIISAGWELAAYVLVFSFLSVNLPKLFQKKADLCDAEYLKQREEHLAKTGEVIRNFAVIRVFGLFEDQKRKYNAVLAELRGKEDARNRLADLVHAFSVGISELSFALIIIFAVLLLVRGQLSVGYITSLSQLLGGVMYPFEMLPGYLLAYRTGRELFRRNECEFEKESERPEGKVSLGEPVREIKANHLFYGYQNGAPVLKDISVVLEKGKKYALVGDSGSGKSTLAKLLAGFLRASEGAITVNDICIQNVKEESLYRDISYQDQNVSVFRDTIRNNILLGNTCAEERWEQITQDACIEELLRKLPSREDSWLEEGGRNVSGGELQRIALARSLSTDPQFMIFDEIAASLDKRNAREVERNILNLTDRGILMITHHLYEENMKLYDKIFVMNDGRIVEEGRWEELMRRRGFLYELACEE